MTTGSVTLLGPQPVIRSFDWTDYEGAAQVWRATGRDVVPQDQLRTTIEHCPGLMVVAADPAAEIVGVVLGTFDGRRGWIHRLAVHPEHRRKGLAWPAPWSLSWNTA